MADRRPRMLPIALTVVGVLLVASCGGDDTENAIDADATSGDATGAFAADGECAFLGEFSSGVDAAFDAEEALSSDEAVDLGAVLAPLAEEIDDVAAAAPDEIGVDFETVSDGFQQAASALEGVVIDMSDPENFDPEVLAELQALEESFGGEFEQATRRIDTWISENCQPA